MVAGNNYVDINGKITGTVKAQGRRQGYGIDVATIGGVYANKISLISSEKGVGVRNSGIIAGTESTEYSEECDRFISDNWLILRHIRRNIVSFITM